VYGDLLTLTKPSQAGLSAQGLFFFLNFGPNLQKTKGAGARRASNSVMVQ